MDATPSPIFGRVATAMITPFRPDGEVDHEAAWNLARHLTENGTDTLVVTGTTGESPTLSTAEKLALYSTVVEAVAERKTLVMAGTGSYDTRSSIDMSTKAADIGCDAVLAVTPYYNKPEQRGLVAHFEAIADASPIPVMIYNIPGRTGRLLELDTLERLSSHDNIVAVKDAVEDLMYTSFACERMPGFPVYSGNDALTLPMMAVGAVGVVSVLSHLAGPQISAMIKAVENGDGETARRIHQMLLPLFRACFAESNPIPIKAAVNRFWAEVGEPRLPLTPAEESTIIALEKAIGVLNSG